MKPEVYSRLIERLMRIPTHPGEVLLREFLNPLGRTQAQLARELGIPVQRVNALVNGKLQQAWEEVKEWEEGPRNARRNEVDLEALRATITERLRLEYDLASNKTKDLDSEVAIQDASKAPPPLSEEEAERRMVEVDRRYAESRGYEGAKPFGNEALPGLTLQGMRDAVNQIEANAAKDRAQAAAAEKIRRNAAIRAKGEEITRPVARWTASDAKGEEIETEMVCGYPSRQRQRPASKLADIPAHRPAQRLIYVQTDEDDDI
jgi:hypothetical protein